MKKFMKGAPGGQEYYRFSDIRKAKPHLVYWVILPQGTKRRTKHGIMYTRMIQCRNMKQAFRVAERYDAPYIERLIKCKLGRWPLGAFYMHKGTIEELWNEWKKRPEIDLNEKGNAKYE